MLRALPSIQQSNQETRTLHKKDTREATPQGAAAEKFDARALVFACLSENPGLKLAEIEQRAFARNQVLSQPTASRYRKQFLSKIESSSVVKSKSSTIKAESTDESSTMKARGIDESPSGESSSIDVRRVVGE